MMMFRSLAGKYFVQTTFLLAFFAFFLFAAGVEAEQTSQPAQQANNSSHLPPEFAETITSWNSELKKIEESLKGSSVADSAIRASRERLDDLRDQIEDIRNKLTPRIDDKQDQLKKLGPAPNTDQLAEPKANARLRAELNKALAGLTAAQGAANAAWVKTNSLLDTISQLRRNIFEERILKRTISPFSPIFWKDLSENSDLKSLGITLQDWWQRTSKTEFLIVLIGAVLLWTLLTFVAFRVVRHVRHWDAPEPPSEWRRVETAALVVLLRAIPPTVVGAFLYFSLTSPDPLPPQAVPLVWTAIQALLVITAVSVVGRTALSIRHGEWRLMPLSDLGATKLYRRLLFIVFLYAADLLTNTLAKITQMHFSASILQSYIISLVLAYLIISILRIRAENGDGTGERHPIGSHYIRIPLWLIAIAITGCVLTGYAALARFIITQLIVTGTILLVTYLFLLGAAAFKQTFAEENSPLNNILRKLGLSQEYCERLALPVTLLLRGIIIFVAVPLVLLQWNNDVSDILGWLEKALFGFDIGGWHVSLITVVIALVIFVAVFAASKVVQSWLDNHVLAAAGVEGSVRQSVSTGVGYLGAGIAALLAVSYTGMDFSNLAILAGALSVGLGFGLQSIVNNFVSGLIVLAERHIKVGDWIIVGSDEGIVRRISVRSTEIETFDRANVIIPNSQLISQSVRNWTLHNNVARVTIPVGVHYDSDPEEVRDVLLDAAKEHPLVLSNPEPFVAFEDFGDSALSFTLFVYLSNVMRSYSTRTDLRIAILKEFRKRGIEIPYPQTDVHMRDLGWIKNAIVQRMMKPKEEASESSMSVRNFDAETGPIQPGPSASNGPGKRTKKDKDEGEENGEGDGDGGE
jgi:small-conductance mechanosensitive channel